MFLGYFSYTLTLLLFVSQSANIFVQTIMIGDCNDEPPVFTDSLYIFSVSENSPAGDITGPTIDSTDADATNDNKNVMYRATNLGADSWFDIYADVSIGHMHSTANDHTLYIRQMYSYIIEMTCKHSFNNSTPTQPMYTWAVLECYC